MERPPRPTSLRGLAPPMLARPDADYPRLLSQLAGIHAQVLEGGMTLEAVLERARIEMAMGNYLDAALDAERAARFAPDDPDVLFVRGHSYLALAAVKHGVAEFGIGGPVARHNLPRRAHLLAVAKECFRNLLTNHPKDYQAKRALGAAERLQHDLERRTQFGASLSVSAVPPA